MTSVGDLWGGGGGGGGAGGGGGVLRNGSLRANSVTNGEEQSPRRQRHKSGPKRVTFKLESDSPPPDVSEADTGVSADGMPSWWPRPASTPTQVATSGQVAGSGQVTRVPAQGEVVNTVIQSSAVVPPTNAQYTVVHGAQRASVSPGPDYSVPGNHAVHSASRGRAEHATEISRLQSSGTPPGSLGQPVRTQQAPVPRQQELELYDNTSADWLRNQMSPPPGEPAFQVRPSQSGASKAYPGQSAVLSVRPNQPADSSVYPSQAVASQMYPGQLRQAYVAPAPSQVVLQQPATFSDPRLAVSSEVQRSSHMSLNNGDHGRAQPLVISSSPSYVSGAISTRTTINSAPRVPVTPADVSPTSLHALPVDGSRSVFLLPARRPGGPTSVIARTEGVEPDSTHPTEEDFLHHPTYPSAPRMTSYPDVTIDRAMPPGRQTVESQREASNVGLQARYRDTLRRLAPSPESVSRPDGDPHLTHHKPEEHIYQQICDEKTQQEPGQLQHQPRGFVGQTRNLPQQGIQQQQVITHVQEVSRDAGLRPLVGEERPAIRGYAGTGPSMVQPQQPHVQTRVTSVASPVPVQFHLSQMQPQQIRPASFSGSSVVQQQQLQPHHTQAQLQHPQTQLQQLQAQSQQLPVASISQHGSDQRQTSLQGVPTEQPDWGRIFGVDGDPRSAQHDTPSQNTPLDGSDTRTSLTSFTRRHNQEQFVHYQTPPRVSGTDTTRPSYNFGSVNMTKTPQVIRGSAPVSPPSASKPELPPRNYLLNPGTTAPVCRPSLSLTTQTQRASPQPVLQSSSTTSGMAQTSFTPGIATHPGFPSTRSEATLPTNGTYPNTASPSVQFPPNTVSPPVHLPPNYTAAATYKSMTTTASLSPSSGYSTLSPATLSPTLSDTSTISQNSSRIADASTSGQNSWERSQTEGCQDGPSLTFAASMRSPSPRPSSTAPSRTNNSDRNAMPPAASESNRSSPNPLDDDLEICLRSVEEAMASLQDTVNKNDERRRESAAAQRADLNRSFEIAPRGGSDFRRLSFDGGEMQGFERRELVRRDHRRDINGGETSEEDGTLIVSPFGGLNPLQHNASHLWATGEISGSNWSRLVVGDWLLGSQDNPKEVLSRQIALWEGQQPHQQGVLSISADPDGGFSPRATPDRGYASRQTPDRGYGQRRTPERGYTQRRTPDRGYSPGRSLQRLSYHELEDQPGEVVTQISRIGQESRQKLRAIAHRPLPGIAVNPPPHDAGLWGGNAPPWQHRPASSERFEPTPEAAGIRQEGRLSVSEDQYQDQEQQQRLYQRQRTPLRDGMQATQEYQSPGYQRVSAQSLTSSPPVTSQRPWSSGPGATYHPGRANTLATSRSGYGFGAAPGAGHYQSQNATLPTGVTPDWGGGNPPAQVAAPARHWAAPQSPSGSVLSVDWNQLFETASERSSVVEDDLCSVSDAGAMTREQVVTWYQRVELPRGQGVDALTGRAAAWFHGLIGRQDAESRLLPCPPGAYLVRLSLRIQGYTLSYRCLKRCKHFLVEASPEGYSFYRNQDRQFSTLGPKRVTFKLESDSPPPDVSEADTGVSADGMPSWWPRPASSATPAQAVTSGQVAGSGQVTRVPAQGEVVNTVIQSSAVAPPTNAQYTVVHGAQRASVSPGPSYAVPGNHAVHSTSPGRAEHVTEITRLQSPGTPQGSLGQPVRTEQAPVPRQQELELYDNTSVEWLRSQMSPLPGEPASQVRLIQSGASTAYPGQSTVLSVRPSQPAVSSVYPSQPPASQMYPGQLRQAYVAPAPSQVGLQQPVRFSDPRLAVSSEVQRNSHMSLNNGDHGRAQPAGVSSNPSYGSGAISTRTAINSAPQVPVTPTDVSPTSLHPLPVDGSRSVFLLPARKPGGPTSVIARTERVEPDSTHPTEEDFLHHSTHPSAPRMTSYPDVTIDRAMPPGRQTVESQREASNVGLQARYRDTLRRLAPSPESSSRPDGDPHLTHHKPEEHIYQQICDEKTQQEPGQLQHQPGFIGQTRNLLQQGIQQHQVITHVQEVSRDAGLRPLVGEDRSATRGYAGTGPSMVQPQQPHVQTRVTSVASPVPVHLHLSQTQPQQIRPASFSGASVVQQQQLQPQLQPYNNNYSHTQAQLQHSQTQRQHPQTQLQQLQAQSQQLPVASTSQHGSDQRQTSLQGVPTEQPDWGRIFGVGGDPGSVQRDAPSQNTSLEGRDTRTSLASVTRRHNQEQFIHYQVPPRVSGTDTTRSSYTFGNVNITNAPQVIRGSAPVSPPSARKPELPPRNYLLNPATTAPMCRPSLSLTTQTQRASPQPVLQSSSTTPGTAQTSFTPGIATHPGFPSTRSEATLPTNGTYPYTASPSVPFPPNTVSPPVHLPPNYTAAATYKSMTTTASLSPSSGYSTLSPATLSPTLSDTSTISQNSSRIADASTGGQNSWERSQTEGCQDGPSLTFAASMRSPSPRPSSAIPSRTNSSDRNAMPPAASESNRSSPSPLDDDLEICLRSVEEAMASLQDTVNKNDERRRESAAAQRPDLNRSFEIAPRGGSDFRRLSFDGGEMQGFERRELVRRDRRRDINGGETSEEDGTLIVSPFGGLNPLQHNASHLWATGEISGSNWSRLVVGDWLLGSQDNPKEVLSRQIALWEGQQPHQQGVLSISAGPDGGFSPRATPDRGYASRQTPDRGYGQRRTPERGYTQRRTPDRGYSPGRSLQRLSYHELEDQPGEVVSQISRIGQESRQKLRAIAHRPLPGIAVNPPPHDAGLWGGNAPPWQHRPVTSERFEPTPEAASIRREGRLSVAEEQYQDQEQQQQLYQRQRTPLRDGIQAAQEYQSPGYQRVSAQPLTSSPPVTSQRPWSSGPGATYHPGRANTLATNRSGYGFGAAPATGPYQSQTATLPAGVTPDWGGGNPPAQVAAPTRHWAAPQSPSGSVLSVDWNQLFETASERSSVMEDDLCSISDAGAMTREQVVTWYQRVELPRGQGVDALTGRAAAWFHGLIGRPDAEARLLPCPPGAYLVRLSLRIQGYTLSYRCQKRCKHFLVEASPEGYSFYRNQDRQFSTLDKLLRFHSIQPITIQGAELLRFPCTNHLGATAFQLVS